ncbi:MAG: hypothetical protein ABI183_22150, partial [Polyangiaceae bacterium]
MTQGPRNPGQPNPGQAGYPQQPQVAQQVPANYQQQHPEWAAHGIEQHPDQAPAADLPQHARERLLDMRNRRFFTSDLSVNEFLVVKEVGFDPLGL